MSIPACRGRVGTYSLYLLIPHLDLARRKAIADHFDAAVLETLAALTPGTCAVQFDLGVICPNVRNRHEAHALGIRHRIIALKFLEADSNLLSYHRCSLFAVLFRAARS